MSNFVQKSIFALNFLNVQHMGLKKYFGDNTIPDSISWALGGKNSYMGCTWATIWDPSVI